jgi:hypothetical protein
VGQQLAEPSKQRNSEGIAMETYTVLTGEGYSVTATSMKEALWKFYWSNGNATDEEVSKEGFDSSDWTMDQVGEPEVMTEVSNG